MKPLLCFLLAFVALKTNAQVASTYTFVQFDGAYTSITGDGGTVLGDQNSDDELFITDVTGNPASQTAAGFPIGFTFNYDGTAYTQFGVSANGYIMLGNLPSFTMPSYPACNCFGGGFSGINNPNGIALWGNSEIISALNYDLQGQPGSSIQYLTWGVAPNRILTVQFEGFRSYGQAGDNYNFQINLWESQDIVEIVYGPFAHNATQEDARVGLYGSSNADFYFRSDAGGGWANTVNGAGGGSSVGLSDVEIPTSGLTFHFGLIASLPIELISFNAESVKKGVELSWSTATETNNSFFTIERSADAQNFSEVASVKSKADKGNSLVRLNYTFTDENPLKGTSYYRLKQTDYNGRYKYFKIVPVTITKGKDITFSIHPNPNHGEFTLDFTGIENNHEVQIVLYDELGKLVYSNSFFTQQASNTVNIIPEEKIAKGNYLCSLILEGIKYNVKVVVN